MAHVCSGCDLSAWLVTARFHGEIAGNGSSAVEFFRDHGVLPKKVCCPHCKCSCLLKQDTNMWYCPQTVKIPYSPKRKKCNFEVSDFKGTFLANAHIEPWKVLLFINHWLEKKWDNDAITQNLKFSASTIDYWRSSCLKVAKFWLTNQKPIGGLGIVVEINKILLMKQKYEGNQESDIWIFGGIEKRSKKSFLIPYEDEKRKELITPFIQQYIRPGSVLVSDHWCSHLTLNNIGYSLHIVNKSKKFLDPDKSGIHTENINLLCRNVKEWMGKRSGLCSEYFMQYLVRYLFIHQFQTQLLHHFLIGAARMYPPQTLCQPQRTLIIPLIEAPVPAILEVPAERDLDQAHSSPSSSTDTTAKG